MINANEEQSQLTIAEGYITVSDVPYNLDRVFRNDAVLSNEAYTKALNTVKDVCIAYQGSKSYIRDTIEAIISYIKGIEKVVLLGEASGAGIISVSEGIPIQVYDTSYLTNTLKCMSRGSTARGLISACDMVSDKLNGYLENPSPDMLKAIDKAIAKDIKAYKKKHDGAEPDETDLERIELGARRKEAMRLVFNWLFDNSSSNFQDICYKLKKTLEQTHTIEEIDGKLLELSAGLSLFLTYGSYRNAGVSFSHSDMGKFMSNVQALRDAYCEHSDMGITEFVHKYFFEGLCGNNPPGYQQLTRILKTELEIMRRDVTVYQEDFFKVLDNGVFDKDCLIIADPPYPSEKGDAYKHDGFNSVETNYDLLIKLMKSGAKFIMFCDTNMMEIFEPAMGSLNFYAITPRRDKDVQDVIITNCDLPCGEYSELPETFQKLAQRNYETIPDPLGDDKTADGYQTDTTCLPLREISSLIHKDLYRQRWCELLYKAGFKLKAVL